MELCEIKLLYLHYLLFFIIFFYNAEIVNPACKKKSFP